MQTYCPVLCSQGKPQRRANVVQELTIMERLGGHVHHAATASQLAEALVSMLQLGGALMTNSKGQRKGVLDEMSAARALGALAALWSKTADGEAGVVLWLQLVRYMLFVCHLSVHT